MAYMVNAKSKCEVWAHPRPIVFQNGHFIAKWSTSECQATTYKMGSLQTKLESKVNSNYARGILVKVNQSQGQNGHFTTNWPTLVKMVDWHLKWSNYTCNLAMHSGSVQNLVIQHKQGLLPKTRPNGPKTDSTTASEHTCNRPTNPGTVQATHSKSQTTSIAAIYSPHKQSTNTDKKP